MPEQEYVYYANWRVISGGYMSISISALLISKAESVAKLILLEHSYCPPAFSKLQKMYYDVYNRVSRLTKIQFTL